MSSPLLFIHYGAPSWLRLVLETAVRTNPDKRIFLLGDDSNRHLCPSGATHVLFEKLADRPSVREFDRVFQPIQGRKHRYTKLGGTDFWLRFVFRRWFLMRELLAEQDIDSFWTFDSDTLILAPLAPREARYAPYECTQQCYGACLNGYVGSRDLVLRYTDAMIAQFQDETFLDSQRQRVEREDGLSFNEMDAFSYFRDQVSLHARHAALPLEGEAFDDALAFHSGYEPAPRRVLDRTTVKRLWTGPSKGLFARREDEALPHRLITANMSWMPDFLYHRIASLAVAPEQDAPIQPTRDLDLSEPLPHFLRRKAWVLQAHAQSRLRTLLKKS